MITLAYFFYSLTPLFIIHEAITFNKAKTVAKLRRNEISELNIKQIFFGLFQLVYFCWGAIGLMTSQWLIFLILMGMGLIPTKKFSLENAEFLIKFDAIVSIIMLLFMLVNRFYLNN